MLHVAVHHRTERRVDTKQTFSVTTDAKLLPWQPHDVTSSAQPASLESIHAVAVIIA